MQFKTNPQAFEKLLLKVIPLNQEYAKDFEQTNKNLVQDAEQNISDVKPNQKEYEKINSTIDEEIKKKEELKKLRQKVKLNRLGDIMKMDLPEQNWIVPNFLPEGLAILGGRPKKGKSFFSLNLAIAVASGSKAFNYFETEKKKVLYISLEDNYRRIKTRASIMLKGIEAPELLFNEELVFPMLNDEGIKILESFLVLDKIKLIIIDTLGRCKDQSKKNNNQYLDEYQFTAELQRLALKYNACIFVITHTSKPNGRSSDIFDSFNGTTGMNAAVDSQLILEDKPDQAKTVLHISGRDIQSSLYDVSFNGESMTWQIEGKTKEIETTVERQEILEVFENDYSKVLQNKDIAEALGKKPNAVSTLLKKMVSTGIIEQHSYGKYKLKEVNYNNDFDF